MSPFETWIREQIESAGPVPFERFMAWALYHPEHGYYAAGRAAPGRDEGDFTTAPQMSGLFGACLATFLSAADRALGCPRPFLLVEGGAGEGRLGVSVLDTLRSRDSDLYDRLRYAPEESGPAWSARQDELLSAHAQRILRPAPDGFEGVYLSNELVDAFPVHRLIRRDGETLEIHVGVQDGRLVEVSLPPSRPDLLRALQQDGIELEEGCEAEVNLQARSWMESVAGRLGRGYVVTIDYGDEADALYGPHRPAGTCLGYERHRTTEDLLAKPGLKDLTAHVNFTALKKAGFAAGLAPSLLLTQRDFLFALGLLREMEGLEELGLSEPELIAARQAVAPLLFPGMGETFRVLVQAKGAPLEGLPLDPAAALGPSPQGRSPSSPLR